LTRCGTGLVAGGWWFGRVGYGLGVHDPTGTGQPGVKVKESMIT
jgi:hypothetical protein